MITHKERLQIEVDEIQEGKYWLQRTEVDYKEGKTPPDYCEFKEKI